MSVPEGRAWYLRETHQSHSHEEVLECQEHEATTDKLACCKQSSVPLARAYLSFVPCFFQSKGPG